MFADFQIGSEVIICESETRMLVEDFMVVAGRPCVLLRPQELSVAKLEAGVCESCGAFFSDLIFRDSHLQIVGDSRSYSRTARIRESALALFNSAVQAA